METELEFEEEEEAEETEATEVETEEEEEAVEDESEEEGDEEDEEEDDDEDEEEEIEEFEEMTSPRVSCWLGADGKKYKGVMTVDDDINYPGNKCQYDDCVICLQPMTHRGKHRLCCVPCGHLYGFSCIKKWLLQSSFSGKCPQCNFVCECKDVVPLVASTVCVRAHQKATSARYFPFTAQGFIEFKEHEWVRHLDAEKRYHDDYKRLVDVVEQQGDLARRQAALKPQWDDLIARGLALNQRAKKLGQPVGELEGFDALQRQHRDLRQLHEAWGQRFKALGRVAIVLRRWIDVWVQRYHAYGPSLKFFYAMCQEYFAQQKNTEPCAAINLIRQIMGDENDRSMEIELEEEEVVVVEQEEEEEEEEEEEDDVEVESDKEEDEEDEEEEIEELEEMTSPRVSCWLGADGKIYKGVMTVDDDINYPGNKCQYDDCSICYQSMTNRGKHRLCCLPCGHLYGFSCITKLLLQSSFSGKCPQCNFVCAHKDIVLLHASTLCVRAHQKATSARYFPFTEQGFIEFKEHEWVRHLDAQKRFHDDLRRLVVVVDQQGDLARQQASLKPQWDELSAWGLALDQRAKKLGQPVGELEGFDAFHRSHCDLRQLHEAWGQRFKALGRVADALRQRIYVLIPRYRAYEPNLKFFNEMYKEHLAQQKNTEPCAASTS